MLPGGYGGMRLLEPGETICSTRAIVPWDWEGEDEGFRYGYQDSLWDIYLNNYDELAGTHEGSPVWSYQVTDGPEVYLEREEDNPEYRCWLRIG